MRIFIIAIFFLSGVYRLYSQFSLTGMPSSVGEILNTNVVYGVVMLAAAAGLVKYQAWARHLAIGVAIAQLIETVLVVLAAPALFVAALFIGPMIGANGATLIVFVIIGIALQIGFPALVLVHFFKRDNAEYYAGAIEGESSVKDRALIYKDWIALIMAFVVVGITKMDKLMPSSITAQRELKEVKSLVKEIANDPAVKDMAEKAKIEKERREEEAFNIARSYFTADERSVVFMTSDSVLRKLDLASGQFERLADFRNGNLQQRSVDGRYVLMPSGDSVFDTQTKSPIKLVGEYRNVSGQQSFLGFGPTPTSALIFENSARTFLMKDFTTGAEIFRIEAPTVEGLNGTQYWTPSRKFVFSMTKDKKWIFVDAVAGRALWGDFASEYKEFFIADENDAGFAYIGKGYSGVNDPFFYNMTTNQMVALDFDEKPLGLSLLRDQLITTSVRENKLRVRKPSQNFAVTQEYDFVAVEPRHIRGTNYVIYMGRDQLQVLNVETRAITPIGRKWERFQDGVFEVSPTGALVLHSQHRKVQVLWSSEIGKETPQYLQTELAKD